MIDNRFHQKWLAFTGISLLSFGGYLDYTVVNIALPTIQQELHTNLTALQWVMNIYFLVLCILATIMGRCGDLYGRRHLFYIGVAIFTGASLFAGFANQISWLILGRLLQGVGGAMIFPLGPSLLPAVFPENQHAKAIGWLGSLGGIALALGPILGGFIVTHWGWRWIFFINIPLTLIGFLFCINTVKESVAMVEERSMDWQGMLFLAIAMSGIVLGLIHSATAGWGNVTTLSLLVAGIVSGIFLVNIELRKPNPLIDFRDFSRLLFYSGAILCALSGVFSAVALFFDPLYLQIIRGQSPQLSGLILFVIPLAVLSIALIAGWLVQVFGLINTILIGLMIGSLAAFMQVFFTPSTSIGFIVITFFALGGMWAMGNTISIIAAQTAVGPARVSVATGTMVTTFSIGGSIGLAISVMFYHFASIYHTGAQSALQDLLANPAHALQIPMNAALHTLFNNGFMRGFSAVMWFLFVACIVGLLSIFIWKKISQKRNYANEAASLIK